MLRRKDFDNAGANARARLCAGASAMTCQYVSSKSPRREIKISIALGLTRARDYASARAPRHARSRVLGVSWRSRRRRISRARHDPLYRNAYISTEEAWRRPLGGSWRSRRRARSLSARWASQSAGAMARAPVRAIARSLAPSHAQKRALSHARARLRAAARTLASAHARSARALRARINVKKKPLALAQMRAHERADARQRTRARACLLAHARALARAQTDVR